MDFDDMTEIERAAQEPCLMAEAWGAIKRRRSDFFRAHATQKQINIMHRLERGDTFLQVNNCLGVSYADIAFVAEQIGMQPEGCAA